MFEQFNPNLSVYFEEQVSKRLWFLLSLNRLHNVTLNMFDKSMAHKRYVSPPPLNIPPAPHVTTALLLQVAGMER